MGCYWLIGSLSDLAISGGQVKGTAELGAQYMLPFALDMPPSWSLTYYDASTAGYTQVA